MHRIEPGQAGEHVTYCRLCEAQCGMVATVEAGRIKHIGPDRSHVTSEGHICVKGPAMAEIAYDPDRVLYPLKRSGGPGEFVRTSWEEALADIASRLTAITRDHGGEALGMYVGNPAAFSTLHYPYAGAFGAAFGSGKMFGPLHVDTGGKQLACELVYGGSHRFTFPDLERCDMLLVLGANPLVSHMSLVSEPRARHKLEAIHARGGVVVVDPRRTETARRFEHLGILPDTDAWLLAAMLHVIFAEGLCDTVALDARTTGWRSLRETVAAISPERAAALCKVEAEQIVAIARRFATAPRAACYGRVGTNRGRFATLTNVLIEALNIVTGRFGSAGGWMFGAGAFGASLMHPGTEYGTRRSRVGGFPLILGMTPGGELAADILVNGPGRMRALIVDCGNPVLSHPGGAQTAQALEKLDLMVAIDLYVTETSRHADYILPATTFLERADLTDTWSANAPRPWLQFSNAVIPPLGEARHEYDIYGDLLDLAGLPPAFAMLSPDGKRPPLRTVIEAMMAGAQHGLSLEQLQHDHPHGWRMAEHVDPALSWEAVSHADGLLHLWPSLVATEFERLVASEHEPPALKLFGRRKLKSMNSWMHNAPALVGRDEPTLLVHPDDARAKGLGDGDRAILSSKSGRLEVKVQISGDVVRGAVSYPHGWGHAGGWGHANALPGGNINALASADPEDWEPVSGICLLDGIPVELTTIER